MVSNVFSLNHTATTELYTLSLHDALPISARRRRERVQPSSAAARLDWRSSRCSSRVASTTLSSSTRSSRSEEHTSELQSPCNLVCRLLLEKKKRKNVLTRGKTTG